MKAQSWFDVDRKGLQQIVAGRERAHVLSELVQNAWDEASKQVIVTLEAHERGIARLTVQDDNAEGFADLRDAYTLYKPSKKKAEPTKRGRFNVGEKVFLSLCVEAKIATTSGTVSFRRDGTRTFSGKSKTERGTIVSALLRMKREEVAETVASLRRLIPPVGLETTINGEQLEHREPLRTFKATLPTVVMDGDGVLKQSERVTSVALHIPKDGETPMIYEMGIPVVESEMPWHVDVQQKVPLTQDRDNVPVRFRRILTTAALNAAHDTVQTEEATQTWASTAIESGDVEKDAFESIFRARFGDQTVIFDPSDAEANNRAVAEGYVVVHGGNLSGAAWENVRRFETSKPAGQVFPTHPIGTREIDSHIIPKSQWTAEMRSFAAFASALAAKITRPVRVVFYNDIPNASARCGGDGRLDIAMDECGAVVRDWHGERRGKACDLLIHEFAHLRVENHLSTAYYDELTRLGGAMVDLAIREPQTFARETYAAYERSAPQEADTV